MTFQPGQSLLHRLHPVVKLAWLLWATVAIFVFSSAVLPLSAVVCAVGLLGLAGFAPWRVPGLRLWLTLALVILITHALVYREGPTFFGPLTSEGLAFGIRAAARLLAVILMSALFVVTTEPIALACGLMRVGLPYRWGFALVTALRLAPVFRIDVHHVYRAQLVRGVAYDAAGPRRWGLILRHLCLPLLVSALRTAQCLAVSMEGRAFGLHPQRTFVRGVSFGGRDVLAGGLLAASVALAIWYGVTHT